MVRVNDATEKRHNVPTLNTIICEMNAIYQTPFYRSELFVHLIKMLVYLIVCQLMVGILTFDTRYFAIENATFVRKFCLHTYIHTYVHSALCICMHNIIFNKYGWMDGWMNPIVLGNKSPNRKKKSFVSHKIIKTFDH